MLSSRLPASSSSSSVSLFLFSPHRSPSFQDLTFSLKSPSLCYHSTRGSQKELWYWKQAWHERRGFRGNVNAGGLFKGRDLPVNEHLTPLLTAFLPPPHSLFFLCFPCDKMEMKHGSMSGFFCHLYGFGSNWRWWNIVTEAQRKTTSKFHQVFFFLTRAELYSKLDSPGRMWSFSITPLSCYFTHFVGYLLRSQWSKGVQVVKDCRMLTAYIITSSRPAVFLLWSSFMKFLWLSFWTHCPLGHSEIFFQSWQHWWWEVRITTLIMNLLDQWPTRSGSHESFAVCSHESVLNPFPKWVNLLDFLFSDMRLGPSRLTPLNSISECGSGSLLSSSEGRFCVLSFSIRRKLRDRSSARILRKFTCGSRAQGFGSPPEPTSQPSLLTRTRPGSGMYPAM